MPISPKNQHDLATLDSKNPSSAGNGELSGLKSKLVSPAGAVEKDTTLSTEARDETPKLDFDKWLQKSDSDDLSLYIDSSEEQTTASDLIDSSTMDQREGVAPSVASDPEKKQELKETLASLGIDLKGEDIKAEEKTSLVEESDGGMSSTESRSDDDSSTLDFSLSVADATLTDATQATPSKLLSSTSEEGVGRPTDSHIQNMLERLKTSQSLAEADEAIQSLDMALDNRIVPDKADRTHIAGTITKLDGNRIIMEAMVKWQAESSDITDVATCLLVAVTQVVPEASREIAKIGLHEVVKTGKSQPNNYFLRGNILALLLNLSTLEDETTKAAISTDFCIDIVVQTMQKWSDKEYIQKCGAGYFVRINMIQAEQKGKAKLPKEQVNEHEVAGAVAAKEPGSEINTLAKETETVEAKSDEPHQQFQDPPSEEEVAKMLRRLRDSRDGERAGEAVKVLVRATDSRFIKSAADRKKVAEGIVRLNGVAAIILALEKWFAKSQTFAYYALTLLVSISKFAAGSRQTIAMIGCKTVLDAAGKYADNYYIRGNVLILLQNLGNHKHTATKYEVAESDCIDCVIDTMQRWPDDAYIQHCGCDYFARIVGISGMPSKLHAREIDVLLLGVIDTFQQKGDEEICNRARSVIEKIHEDE